MIKLGDFFKTSAANLGRRFGFVGMLPTTSLVLFVLFLVLGGAPAQPPELAIAFAKIGPHNTVEGLVFVLGILALALILQPFQLWLVRLLEGYWGESWLADVLTKVFTIRHRRHRARIQSAFDAIRERAGTHDSTERLEELAAKAGALSERLVRFYPTDRLMPTALGNVLRAAEQNAGAPYGLDAIIIWPRLYAVLPERTAAVVDDQRNQLDIAVRFCVTLILATVISAALLYQHRWWLAVPAATLVLARLSYRAAVASALAYGDGIRTAIDLHRFDLLRALHLPLPTDREAEKKANETLCTFLRQGVPANFLYEHSTHK